MKTEIHRIYRLFFNNLDKIYDIDNIYYIDNNLNVNKILDMEDKEDFNYNFKQCFSVLHENKLDYFFIDDKDQNSDFFNEIQSFIQKKYLLNKESSVFSFVSTLKEKKTLKKKHIPKSLFKRINTLKNLKSIIDCNSTGVVYVYDSSTYHTRIRINLKIGHDDIILYFKRNETKYLFKCLALLFNICEYFEHELKNYLVVLKTVENSKKYKVFF